MRTKGMPMTVGQAQPPISVDADGVVQTSQGLVHIVDDASAGNIVLKQRAGALVSGAIKSFEPRLRELGKIKIGGLSDKTHTAQSGREYRSPVKFDHFQVTSCERSPDGRLIVDESVMTKLGPKPKELEISLMSDDIPVNFHCYYGCYHARTAVCIGDGEVAHRLRKSSDGRLLDGETRDQVACPCDLYESGACKVHGVLTCVLVKSPILGGVYKFRTTSAISVSQILGSMYAIAALTGGRLAGLPLWLTLNANTIDVPDKSGQKRPTTVYVVGLEYRGDAESLVRRIIERREHQLKLSVDLARSEQSLQRLLTVGSGFDASAPELEDAEEPPPAALPQATPTE